MRACLRTLGMALAAVLITGLSVGQRAQVAMDKAVVTWMYGTVQVRHGTAGWASAVLSDQLAPGDAIKTGADSRAELTIGRDGYVRMDESSHLLITHLQADGLASFKAIVGGIWVTIERALTGSNKFEVRMPSAVATVKGTVFRCQVDSDGTSRTTVYEGEVEVQAGDEQVRVRPSEQASIPRGLRIALAHTNLNQDDEEAFVRINRHRDILGHLGNPTIMVSLTEQAGRAHEQTFPCSQALGAALRRNGLTETSIKPGDAARVTVGENGWIRWRERPATDYYVVGRVNTTPARQLNRVFSVRAEGTAHLVDADQQRSLVTVTATVPGIGATQAEALDAALLALGQRLGMELAPRIIRELMAEREGAVRVDLSGVTSREQVAALRDIIVQVSGALRTAPLLLPGDRISLAVAGDVDPTALAAAINSRAADLVQSVRVYGNVVYVKLRPAQG